MMVAAKQIRPAKRPEPATVEALVRAYIDAKAAASEITANTVKSYRQRARSMVTYAPDLAEMHPRQVERRHIVALREAYREVSGQGTSVLSFVRTVFTWAEDIGLVETNPAQKVRGFKRRDGGRRKDCSRAESRALMLGARLAHEDGRIEEDEQDYFYGALILGWRPVELLNMRTQDLDLERMSARPAFKGEGKRRRWKSIGPEMARIFARRAAAVEPGDYLFGGKKPWHHNKPWEAWQRVLPYAQAIGMDIEDPNGPAKRIRPYITRSANMQEKESLGAPLPLIAESVNHSPQSLKVTAQYLGTHAAQLGPLAEQVELSFLSTPKPARSGAAKPGPLPQPSRFQSVGESMHVTQQETATLNVATEGLAKAEIGQRIRSAREKAGKEIRDCARILGKSEATWSNWERLGCDKVTILYRIAALFGLAVRDLLPDSIEQRFEGVA